MVLSARHLPSLPRVLVSPVPRFRRYYEGATTSRPRVPGRLFVSLPGSIATLVRSCLASALLPAARATVRPGALVSRTPDRLCRHIGRGRDLIGSQAPLLYLCLGSKPRSDCRALAIVGRASAAPAFTAAKAPAMDISWPTDRGLSTRCLRFTSIVTEPVQSSLPAGWLAFAGRDLNPRGRFDKFQSVYTIILLS